MKVVKIVQIQTSFATPVLVVNGENSFLVDTGRKGFGEKILQTIKANGLDYSDVKFIILTHTHFDHSGNAAYLKKKTGAKVIVHKSERIFLESGYTRIPLGTRNLAKILSWLGRYIFSSIGKYEPVKTDIIVENKLDLNKYGIDGYIIHTPGHTIGSQSLIMGKTIFAGDVFFYRKRKGYFPPFADNSGLLLKTWEKIFNMDIEFVYSGHGPGFKIDRVKKTFNFCKEKYS